MNAFLLCSSFGIFRVFSISSYVVLDTSCKQISLDVSIVFEWYIARCVGTIVELSEQHTNKPPCFRPVFTDVVRPGEIVFNCQTKVLNCVHTLSISIQQYIISKLALNVNSERLAHIINIVYVE